MSHDTDVFQLWSKCRAFRSVRLLDVNLKHQVAALIMDFNIRPVFSSELQPRLPVCFRDVQFVYMLLRRDEKFWG